MGKLIRPILADVFLRKRLFFMLNQMRKQPAIWVSGPAGCGKTTLVNSYLEVGRIPCLWFEVDEGDADLATFFYYLGQAGKKAAPRKRGFLPLLTPEYLQDIPTFTKRFFEKLYERLQIPSVVVFDNYHEVSTESPFHETILKGLSNLPPGINAILISRSGPPSALIRLRANHLMEILAWKELRLTVEESAGIVKLRSKQKFSKETIAQLHKAADGWAAVLVLMLERPKIEDIELQKAGKVRPEEIFDYFASEIFDRTDKEVQEFLLKTSILPKMTPRMAEELSGLSSAGRLLSMLSRNNYFTEKRFHSEPIYQYHSLFRKFLLSRAKETFPQESLLALFRRAAALLGNDGQIEAAVSLLCEVNDWEGMVRLIMKNAPLMVEQGRYRPLKEWLNSLPKEVMENNPWLLFWMGICSLPFSPSQSQPYFEEAYQRFKSQEDIVGIIQACWGVVYSIVNMAADYTPLDRWISVLEELGRTFKEFPSEEIQLRFASAMFSALVNRQPQHPDIEIWANRALSLAQGSSDLTLKFQTISTEAAYRVNIGDFAKSMLAMNSLKKMAQSRESSPLMHIGLAVLEAYYNNLAGLHEKCLNAVSDALELSRTTGIHTFDSIVLYQGVISALMVSDYKRASNFLEEMGSSLNRFRPWDVCMYHSVKTQEALFRGDLGQAAYHVELATKLRIEADFPLITGWCHIQNAYVMHALGRHREASEHLAHAVDFGHSVKGPNNEYAALLAEALFAFDQGEEESGLVLLGKSFALGKERGYFGAWGPLPSGMAKLCIKALQAGIEVEYAQELIRRLHIVPDQSPIHLENWPWYLKVFTLGRFELLKDGKPIQFSRKIQQKPLSLLKALIALGGREVKEEQIADILWPEADGDAAHRAFVSALHRLRHLVGYEKALHLREGKLTMDNRCFWVDTWALEHIWRQADVQRKEERIDIAVQMSEKAIEMYRGPFLSGETEQPWMVSLRERLRSKYLSCVNRLGQHWLQVGNGEKSIECYLRGLDADDLAEEFYQGLMICYQRLNRETEARAVYHRCRKTLSSDLGIAPSAKTEAIYESITKKDSVHGQMARTNQRLN
jgi:DNA-binding SARP family transcriptional activator